MEDVVSVYVTCGSEEEARELARELVEAKLAACGNVWPIGSVYRWEGEVVEDAEAALVLKTTRALADELVGEVASRHPYEVPCAVAWPIEVGHGPYLDWVRQVTR